MPTERNADILAQFDLLVAAVASLQSRGFAIEVAQATGIGPSISLSPTMFRRVFAGCDATVWRGPHCDDYVIESDGIRYTTKDFDRHANIAGHEVVRLPVAA